MPIDKSGALESKTMGKNGVSALPLGRQIPPNWFEPSIHTAYFHIFAKLLEDRDLPPPRIPVGDPRLLPLIDFLPSFESIDASGNPLIGIEVGSAIPGAAHGPMGMAAISSPSIGAAMEAVVRYVPMRNSLFRYRFKLAGGVASIEFLPRLQLGEYAGFLQYATVFAIFNIFRAISDSVALKSGAIHFPWPAPPGLDRIDGVPTRCLHFGMPTFAIAFPEDIARRPSHTADADLFNRVSMAGEEELRRIAGSTAARVRQLINAEAPAWPSLDQVAERMAVSKRTLARRLSDERISFQDLLDEAKNELASWYLRQTNVPISEIVERTGFSEMSNFSRAFKRLQGISPRDYRSRFKRGGTG
jgi:AraC-like DNA-binding protein